MNWGLAILTGVGFVALSIPSNLTQIGFIAFSAFLVALTFALTSTIRFLSEDRMSIARQIDRINQLMGAFKEGAYLKETSLLEPIWYGWGFNRDKDSNWNLSRIYQMVMWIMLIATEVLLMSKAGLMPAFN